MFKKVQENMLTVKLHGSIMNSPTNVKTYEEGTMSTSTSSAKYVDLVISEAKTSSLRRVRRQYRTCTLSQGLGQKQINLRLPESVQKTILSAYKDGKTVRIFA